MAAEWPALALLQPAPRLPAAPAPLPPPCPLPAPPPPGHASGTPRREAAFAPDRGIQAPGRGSQAGFSTRLSHGRPSGLEARRQGCREDPAKIPPRFRTEPAVQHRWTLPLSGIRWDHGSRSRFSAGDVQNRALAFLGAPRRRQLYPHYIEGKLRPDDVSGRDLGCTEGRRSRHSARARAPSRAGRGWWEEILGAKVRLPPQPRKVRSRKDRAGGRKTSLGEGEGARNHLGGRG